MGLEQYFNDYVFVLIFVVLGIILPVGGMIFGRLLRPQNPYREKLITYESGIDPTGDAHVRFHVAYYIVALEFVVFDVETVFLYPWAVALEKVGWVGLTAGIIFIGILLLGLAYSWKKKVLEWN